MDSWHSRSAADVERSLACIWRGAADMERSLARIWRGERRGGQEDVLLVGATFGALSMAGLCAMGWWRDRSDERVLKIQVDEFRTEVQGAQLVPQPHLDTSQAPKADPAPAELDRKPVPQLDQPKHSRLRTPPGSPMPSPRQAPAASIYLDTEPVLQLRETPGARLETPPGSPPPSPAQAPPGSAERWDHELAQAMAAEAAAAAYVSQSESESPSPRFQVERRAHIVEADDKELELEIEGRAYLVDRTSSRVFSLDGCPAEPQMIGTWDEEASSVSFYLDEFDEKTVQDVTETVAAAPHAHRAAAAGIVVEANTSSRSIPSSAGSSLSPPSTSAPRVTFQMDTVDAAPHNQRANGAAIISEANTSPPSICSAAGSSPSPPPVSAPRVTFQLETPQQSHAAELQHELDRVSHNARIREKELLARLDKLDSALVRVRAEAVATEAAKWRREIGEERISAASALQTQHAQATRKCSEMQLRLKAELDAANRRWRREIGAERISAARELAVHGRQHMSAAKIQGWWRRRHLALDLRTLVQATAARHKRDKCAENATRAALHAAVDLATDPEATATCAMLQGELERVREAYVASLQEKRTAAAAAEEMRDALIDRLDQVCILAVLPCVWHSKFLNFHIVCVPGSIGSHRACEGNPTV